MHVTTQTGMPISKLFAGGAMAVCVAPPTMSKGEAFFHASSAYCGPDAIAIVQPRPATDTVNAEPASWSVRSLQASTGKHSRDCACVFAAGTRVRPAAGESKGPDATVALDVPPPVCPDPEHFNVWMATAAPASGGLLLTWIEAWQPPADAVLLGPEFAPPLARGDNSKVSATLICANLISSLHALLQQAHDPQSSAPADPADGDSGGTTATAPGKGGEKKKKAPAGSEPEQLVRYTDLVSGWGMGSEDWVTFTVDQACELCGFGVLGGTGGAFTGGKDRVLEVRTLRVGRCGQRRALHMHCMMFDVAVSLCLTCTCTARACSCAGPQGCG